MESASIVSPDSDPALRGREVLAGLALCRVVRAVRGVLCAYCPTPTTTLGRGATGALGAHDILPWGLPLFLAKVRMLGASASDGGNGRAVPRLSANGSFKPSKS
mmetsp:Transcript_28323/g.67033  ORF Transcript_28323/g.67033 Transcript_28323/m.67033 type:complete len:104 (-) Transcript_28323:228-539(-)